MAIDPTAVQLALAEWTGAPAKARTAIADQLAARLGCSRSTLYRAFAKVGHAGPAHPRQAKYPERGAWADTLAALTLKAPVGTIPLDLCLEAALRDGLLPPAAGQVRVSEYARLIRERGYRQTEQRGRRLSAEYPMQAVQFDATTSRSFRVLRQLDDGDRLLELWHRPDPASGYKNKPLGADRERLVIYGQWDMCTGYRHARARAALGESGLDAMDYLVASWIGSDDPRDPFRGKPEDLWCDQGPLVKYPATRDLLERLDVHVEVGKPYQHTRQSGIENTWRNVWARFENQFFLRTHKGEKFTLRLSEYSAGLAEYLVEINAKPARCDAHISRRDAWVRGINREGGLRPCPADALETLATEVYRKLDSCGIFSWNNVEYEVPKWHSRKIIARRALDGSDRVIIEIPETGERVAAELHRPLAYGTFKGQPPELPAERAKVRGAGLICTTPHFGPATADAPNVVHLPPRAKPVADLPDPLEISPSYRNLADAMQALRTIYTGPLDALQQQLVEQVVIGSGLNRTAVRDLALQLTTLAAAPAAPVRPTLSIV